MILTTLFKLQNLLVINGDNKGSVPFAVFFQPNTLDYLFVQNNLSPAQGAFLVRRISEGKV